MDEFENIKGENPSKAQREDQLGVEKEEECDHAIWEMPNGDIICLDCGKIM